MNEEKKARNKKIIRTSLVGIAANVTLAAFKATVGLIANSIAIVMDAVNNLSDVLSSLITIVGTKLAERDRDREHPFGHGRIEYFSAIVIAVIILVAGLASLVESTKKVFLPVEPHYTAVTLTVIITAIAVKLALGTFVRLRGIQLNSDALKASGTDALFDAVVTLATLVSAAIMLLWNVNLDGIFGVVISLVIIRAGFSMLRSPLSQLLGEGIPRELDEQLRQEVLQNHPEVSGVADIILNNYGAETIIGSLNVGIPDTMTAREIHSLTRTIATEIMLRHGITVNVGIYATNTATLDTLRLQVSEAAKAIPHVLDTHALYIYDDRHTVTIDVIPDDAIRNDDAFRQQVSTSLHSQFPDFDFLVVVDHNYTR